MFYRQTYRRSASHGNSDVGDVKFVTEVGVRIPILVTFFECWCPNLCKKMVVVADQNGQNSHQHLEIVTNTFRRGMNSWISTNSSQI